MASMVAVCLACLREFTLPVNKKGQPIHWCQPECSAGSHFDHCVRCRTALIVFWTTGASLMKGVSDGSEDHSER